VPKTRKIPMRMCVGCGAMRPKTEMVRVVRTPQGEVKVDTTRSAKMSGRGAYVEPKEECLQAARKGRKLDRALECEVPEAVLAELEQEIRRRAAALQGAGG